MRYRASHYEAGIYLISKSRSASVVSIRQTCANRLVQRPFSSNQPNPLYCFIVDVTIMYQAYMRCNHYEVFICSSYAGPGFFCSGAPAIEIKLGIRNLTSGRFLDGGN